MARRSHRRELPESTTSRSNPIALELGAVEKVGENEYVSSATVNLKTLGKNFTRGFNQFTVDVDGETDAVMLDLEL